MDASFIHIDRDLYAYSSYVMDNSIVVADGVSLSAPDILVDGSFTIENFGTITGDINVCDGCQLTIRNMGVFNATFDLESGASIVQVISNPTDMNSIDFGVDYDLHVLNSDGISLSDVLDFGGDAKSILLRNSFVLWDVYNRDLAKLSLDGDIKIKIDDIGSIADNPILYDVADNVNVRVVMDNQNPLFVLHTYRVDDDVYVKQVRETDYTKILSPQVGGYINSLRETNKGNALTSALDSAMTMNHINEIMADSVRISPINLMNPVRVFNQFEMTGFNHVNGIAATYLMSDDIGMYGLNIGAGFNKDNISLGMRAYINRLDATDGFDEFYGNMFGATLYGTYNVNNSFLRSMLGMNLTLFDIENVFDGAVSVDNPHGVSMVGVIDVGYRFYIKDGFYVAPFVGISGEYINVAHDSESVFAGRVGVGSGYSFSVMGIAYDYGAHININTDDTLVAGVHVGFMSLFDMMGGHIDLDFVENKIGRGYKITAGLDFKF